MMNSRKSKKAQKITAIIVIVLVAAMVIGSLAPALFY